MRLDLLSADDLPVEVGRYTLLSLIGEGGMARVFRAQMRGELGFFRPAAVKVVLPARGEKAAELRQQLITEARVGGLLNHPNIVQTFDCGELLGFPYIAMELVEGVSLSELVGQGGPLSPPVALDVAIQTCRGLHHAHFASHAGETLEVVHRDIKPSNLLVRRDGVIKIVDFGIAKAQMVDAQSTASGMTKGTPSYMSPEQLNADQLDGRSDLFTLGAVIWYALTGKTLFAGNSLTEVMMRIIRVEETLAAQGTLEVAESLAPGLGGILAKLLTGDRDARFDSALALEEALQELQSTMTIPSFSLAEVVVASFPTEGARPGPLPGAQSMPSGPRASPSGSRPGADALAPPEGPGGRVVAATRAMPSAASVGPTRAFPAGPAPEPTGEVWPFEEEAEEQVEEVVPLSTQTRPAFDPAEVAAAEAGTEPFGRDAETSERRRERSRRQAAALQRQRILVVFAGAALGALLVMLLFVGWRVVSRGDGEPDPGETVVSRGADPELDLALETTPAPSAAKRTTRTERTPTREPRTRREPRTPPVEPRTPAPAVSHVEPVTAAEPATPTRPEDLAVFSEPTTPVPEPVTSPAVVRLTVTHTPVVRAALGSSKTIEARVGGPEGTVVQLFWGPENGPYDSRPMKASSTGTYRAMLSFDAPGKVQYWIVARHPEAEPSRVMSGDRFNPHVVSVL